MRVRVEQLKHVLHAPWRTCVPVQRHSARPRGAMPQDARPQVVKPHGGRARRDSDHGQYDFGPRGGSFSFQSHSSSGPRFPPRGARFLKWDMACLVFFLILFLGK